MDNFFEFQMMAEVEPFFVFHGAGSDVSWSLASNIAKVIKEQHENYDGFIITHSLDNIVYTSSLLSFMIQNSTKPIIFTASVIPDETAKEFISPRQGMYFGEFETLNLRAGLINTVQIATMDIAEIGIVIGNHLMRAVQFEPKWLAYNGCIDAERKSFLAKIQFGIHLASHATKRSKGTPDFNLKYNGRIKAVSVYPDATLSNDFNDIDGIFIIAGQEQLVPSSWQLPANIPICAYSTGNNKKFNNIITCDSMVTEAAISKFVWTLGQSKNIKEIKKIMSKNIVGEY
ncbi:MAG: asparaginase domain-containing protein [Patescibacteria group bacterium]